MPPDPIITAATVHDWERVMDEFDRQHPEATFRGLYAEPMGHGPMTCVAFDDAWMGIPAYQWPDEDPWLGINVDGTRIRKGQGDD